MVGSIQASMGAITHYGTEMASVSDRISKAFREDSDVSVEKEFAKSMLIEHGLNANVKAVRTQDDMIGSLLDIVA